MNTMYINSPISLDEKGKVTRTKTSFAIPILEDFDIEAQSEFGSYGDIVPMIQDITGILTTAATIGGTASTGTVQINNMLSAQRWMKTNPVKIAVTLHFYTKTNPVNDVVNKINTLLALHLPYTIGTDLYLPGINSKNMKEVTKSMGNLKAEEVAVTSLVDILIPGVVYINGAMLYDIKPTYSRQLTKSGYPLWAIASCQFWGVQMARIENFTIAKEFTKIVGKYRYKQDTSISFGNPAG